MTICLVPRVEFAVVDIDPESLDRFIEGSPLFQYRYVERWEVLLSQAFKFVPIHLEFGGYSDFARYKTAVDDTLQGVQSLLKLEGVTRLPNSIFGVKLFYVEHPISVPLLSRTQMAGFAEIGMGVEVGFHRFDEGTVRSLYREWSQEG